MGAARAVSWGYKLGKAAWTAKNAAPLMGAVVRGSIKQVGTSIVDSAPAPKLLAQAVPPKLLGQGKRWFVGDSAVEHFTKHARGVSAALGRDSYNLAEYVNDANYVIQHGTWVPELNAYIRLIGGSGSAKVGFVGVSRSTGHITTFHIKTVADLARKAPSLGWVR